jgi:predicted glycosyltransferase
MRVLFDLTHPANVHLFKHLIRSLRASGAEVVVASRDKDVTVALLDAEGIEHVCLTRRGEGLAGLAAELVLRTARLRRLAVRFQPDVLVAAEGGVSIGPVGAILRRPRVVFAQVDRARLQNRLGLPWATTICTGTGYRLRHGSRQRRFSGFQTQAYLDPRRFYPDAEVLRRCGIEPDQPFAVVRLVEWTAAHDAGRRGLPVELLLPAIRRLERLGRVILSSEAPMPDALAPWRSPVPVDRLHDLLAFAGVCVAEGGTVAAEAGLLGTPAVTCNSYNFGYLDSLCELGLIRRAEGLTQAMEWADAMRREDGLKQRWRERAAALFASTDDVLEVMRNTIEQAAAPAGRMGRS